MVRATSFCNRSSAASSPDDESDNNARDALLRNGSIGKTPPVPVYMQHCVTASTLTQGQIHSNYQRLR